METSGNRRFLNLTVAVLISVVSILFFWVTTADAQTREDASASSTPDLLREIETLKEQVRYLERRDTARQAWEQSIIKRLRLLAIASLGRIEE